MKKTYILKRRRSDKEKARRKIYGDKGAKFADMKEPCVDLGNVIGTVTTMVTKDLLLIEVHEKKKDMGKIYRIRKLTPRECFRLMDVSETDIDKIQAAGISDSQQYKLAGNSIVVSCLYHIFRELFVTKTQPIQNKLF